MTDNFRALCAELVDVATAHCHPDDDAVGYCAAVLARARAALAQPEPQGPTDEELWELYDEMGGVPEDSAWCLNYARAVLARWGGSAPCPYVVSSDEGTSYCRLAEYTADQLAKLLGEGGG